jgi:hypothetical protein
MPGPFLYLTDGFSDIKLAQGEPLRSPVVGVGRVGPALALEWLSGGSEQAGGVLADAKVVKDDVPLSLVAGAQLMKRIVDSGESESARIVRLPSPNAGDLLHTGLQALHRAFGLPNQGSDTPFIVLHPEGRVLAGGRDLGEVSTETVFVVMVSESPEDLDLVPRLTSHQAHQGKRHQHLAGLEADLRRWHAENN